jgi:hypothetical protein
VTSPLQVPGTQDSLPPVLAALRDAGNQLGTALRRPGLMAAAAAWDPDAVPALCILTLGSASRSSTAAPQKPSGLLLLLQPAAMECLRYVIRPGSLLVELEAS